MYFVHVYILKITQGPNAPSSNTFFIWKIFSFFGKDLEILNFYLFI